MSGTYGCVTFGACVVIQFFAEVINATNTPLPSYALPPVLPWPTRTCAKGRAPGDQHPTLW